MLADYSYLLEDGDFILLEDGGLLVLEDAPPDIALNNFLSVRVGDGMSTGERIR
jgi:hypothetical protein